MEANQEKMNMAKTLAADIITLSRNSLTVNFRFLSRALSRLGFVQDDDIPLATDGFNIFYSPRYILYRYKSEPAAVTRDLLHCLLHCVFRHWLVGDKINTARWDLACDMAVENIINSLSASCVYAERQNGQQLTVDTVAAEQGQLTAERIYKFLEDKLIPDYECEEERENFLADRHELWYGGDISPDKSREVELKEIWEDVSKRMQTELETFTDEKGALTQSLRLLNRRKENYSDFLRRFGEHGEVMRLSPEEFDNNYYTYGLELYGNIPLIEPLEYSEQKLIREFVIAIDTSGSVRGDVVQSFVQQSCDILSQKESFFSRISVHILQCDCEIREDTLITGPEELAEYMKSFEVKGLGQTDFRPVFGYVDDLIAQGKIKNLQGLIYFTDGLGEFPSKPPAYDTAFIIRESPFGIPDIPPWAAEITLTEEEILDRRI